jgi:SAM-dependent methyltransferase
MLKFFYNVLLQFGIEPRKTFYSIKGLPVFFRDYFVYIKRQKNLVGAFPITKIYPILHERFIQAGEAEGPYFHQDIWAAKKIYQKNPKRHLDIGSSVNGFISHLLVFREVELVDIRKLESKVKGLSFLQSDATTLKEFSDNSIESISSLHAGEHFGLGRYGDPVDPIAHLKFIQSLTRVLAPGGRLYFSVPSGVEQLLFNAHRVFAPETVVNAFSGLELLSFSCVKDDGAFYENCSPSEISKEMYGCGFYEYTKLEGK